MRCDFRIFPGAILYVFLHLFMPLPQDLKKPLRVLVTICHTVFSIQKVHSCETLIDEPEKSKKNPRQNIVSPLPKNACALFQLCYYTTLLQTGCQ